VSLQLPADVVVRALGPNRIEQDCRVECEAIQPHARYRIRATFDTQPMAEAEASDCFEALLMVRRQLEEQGLRLCCAGARRDAWASGMQRDMGQGLTAYILSLPRTAKRPPVVEIFEPTDPELVGTVVEQEESFRAWSKSPRTD